MADFMNDRFRSPFDQGPSLGTAPNREVPLGVRPPGPPFLGKPPSVREVPIGVRPPGPILTPAQKLRMIFKRASEQPAFLRQIRGLQNPLIQRGLQRRF